MKTIPWDEIRKKHFTPEQLAESDRWVAAEIRKINLRAAKRPGAKKTAGSNPKNLKC